MLGCGLIAGGCTSILALGAEPPNVGRPATISIRKNTGRAPGAPERVLQVEPRPALPIPASILSARNQFSQAQGNDAQLDELKLQLDKPLQMLMNAELHFVEKVCALSQEQRKPVKQAGKRCLEEATVEFAKLLQAPPNMVLGGLDPQSALSDPRKKLQQRLERRLKDVLEPDQLAHYQAELQSRNMFRRQGQVLLLVARLDSALTLNAEQRSQLTDSLTTKWKEAWEQQPQFWQFNEQYFPQIPDEVVIPHLNEKQKAIWRGLQKIGRVFFGRNGAIDLGMNIDNVPWEPGLDAPEAAPASETTPEDRETSTQLP